VLRSDNTFLAKKRPNYSNIQLSIRSMHVVDSWSIGLSFYFYDYRSATVPAFGMIRSGDVEAVIELLDAGLDPNIKNVREESLLYVAVKYGRLDLAKYLVAKGADIDAESAYGYTPLHVAVFHGQLDIAELLLQNGADINASSNGTTLLHDMSEHMTRPIGNHKLAFWLINQGAKVDAVDDHGDTPLHKSAWKGHAEVAMLLIATGADIDAKNKKGMTPLDLAVVSKLRHVGRDGRLRHRRQVAVEELLRQHGARADVSDGLTAPSAPAALVLPKDADVITNSIGMKLVYIQAGEFTMGSPLGEGEDKGRLASVRASLEFQHQVRLTEGFYMGVSEVTRSQWKAVMGNDASDSKDDEDDLPVNRVSWNDTVEFCSKLSEREGREYRLPTEAQWEYACRAGTTGAYAGTERLDDMGWYKSNSGKRTQPVGLKQANAWGLYDMHGNVSEWCIDWIDLYPAGPVTDPVAQRSVVLKGKLPVVRGGSWMDSAVECRSAFRYGRGPGSHSPSLGLRVTLGSNGTDR
jgi:formylglycine-generating enzyme required for sulfatase activity